MTIQWYPGHMHKAGKEIQEILPEIDLVIEVLDARLPFSSANPKLASLAAGKPAMKLLNKSDLADPEVTRLWLDFYHAEPGHLALALSIAHVEQYARIKDLCRQLRPGSVHKGRFIHALIVGIPNVGKSTLINKLAGRPIAKTANEPAVTKVQQRIDIGDNIILFDTPGMLWPNIENPSSGYRLAATGAIKDTAIGHEDVAHFLAGYLLDHYADALRDRFRMPILLPRSTDLLDDIGRLRGCLRSGGLVDRDKAAKILLAELRSGNLGGISLETPDMMAAELTKLAMLRVEKDAQKRARKQKWRESHR